MQSSEFGLIRRKTVVEGGFGSDSQLRAARRAGIIQPVVRGVSAPADGVALSPDDEYRRRVIAVAGRSRVRVVSHQSAAVCHRMQLFRPDQRCVHFIAQSKGKREGDVHVHHALLAATDIVLIDGIRVTSRAVTACDVARAGTFEQAVAALDDALRSGVSLAELHAIAARTPHAAGIGMLRRALLTADGDAESVGESVSRALMAGWKDIPMPTLQSEFFDADGLIGRTDSTGTGRSPASSMGGSSTSALSRKASGPRTRCTARSCARIGFGPWESWWSGGRGMTSSIQVACTRNCDQR
ncbi:type IV toxin-antitoxin system AbiEi family antitoxin domain-containing protein [Williamsia muralis]|uniref:Uncharacterized protein n=1 Tax=Williamsia marianensis TaxID=85044 RepID=A0ABU4ET37_WILMA|nr:hypothetical protein [Williamsia muralis]MDV7134422.1 hypothetical protein [Williamsia muralis]